MRSLNVTRIVPAMAICAIGGAGFSTSSLKTELNPATKPAGLEAQDESASVSLLGQFRTSLSSWLYLHADVYLHNGVEMRPLTKEEIGAGLRGVGGAHGEEDPMNNDDKIVTVIPSAARDFRGPIGDVERAVSAYKDMRGHTHNDPKAALPLFRLMTMLDPQFIVGWTIGASVIARDHTTQASRAALDFLKEGQEHNPDSIEIYGAIGKLYLTAFATSDSQGHITRPLAKAIPYYAKADELTWNRRDHLTDAERESALENARFYAFSLRDSKQWNAMRVQLERSRKIFPDDHILQRLESEIETKE